MRMCQSRRCLATSPEYSIQFASSTNVQCQHNIVSKSLFQGLHPSKPISYTATVPQGRLTHTINEASSGNLDYSGVVSCLLREPGKSDDDLFKP